MNSYMSLTSDLSTVLSTLGKEIARFYDKKSPYKETVDQMANCFLQHSEKLKDQSERLKAICTAASAIHAPFSLMKVLTEAFLEDRDGYIHYSEKMEQLRNEKVKKDSSANKPSKKELERIVRVNLGLTENEQKLDSATASYAVSLKKFKEQSEILVETRFRILNPALTDVNRLLK